MACSSDGVLDPTNSGRRGRFEFQSFRSTTLERSGDLLEGLDRSGRKKADILGQFTYIYISLACPPQRANKGVY